MNQKTESGTDDVDDYLQGQPYRPEPMDVTLEKAITRAEKRGESTRLAVRLVFVFLVLSLGVVAWMNRWSTPVSIGNDEAVFFDRFTGVMYGAQRFTMFEIRQEE